MSAIPIISSSQLEPTRSHAWHQRQELRKREVVWSGDWCVLIILLFAQYQEKPALIFATKTAIAWEVSAIAILAITEAIAIRLSAPIIRNTTTL